MSKRLRWPLLLPAGLVVLALVVVLVAGVVVAVFVSKAGRFATAVADDRRFRDFENQRVRAQLLDRYRQAEISRCRRLRIGTCLAH